MNMLTLLIALSNPVLNCDDFSDLIWRNVVNRAVECDTMCTTIMLDNPDLIDQPVIRRDYIDLYAMRVCLIYNQIR